MSAKNQNVEELVEKLREKSKANLDRQAFERKVVVVALNKRAKGDFRDMEILKAEARQELQVSSQ